MHVDKFIDSRKTDSYASWFFNLHRLPASLQFKFEDQIASYKLYCSFGSDGRVYRVTGASSMGDIWLAKDLNQDYGYDHRVDIDDCSGWAKTPSEVK